MIFVVVVLDVVSAEAVAVELVVFVRVVEVV